MGAAWAGVLLRQDPSLMALSIGDLSIEMPMWLAIVFILIAIGMILFCSRIINELFSGYYNSRNYFRVFKQKKAKRHTTQALLQLAQSQWELAEKNALKGAAFSELPFLNYVSAAKAAQEQQAWERRDKYLALAVNNVPDSKLSAGIIKAKLQYKQGDLNQSLVTLQELKEINHKHPVILGLLADVYEQTKDWERLLELLPDLKKYNSCPKYMLHELSEQTYRGLLLDKMQQYGKQELIRFWKSIPKSMRNSVNVVETYVSCLCKLDSHLEAAETLKSVLRKIWDKKLVKMYGFVQTNNLGRQLFVAEEWLKEHPGDPILLLTIARLCLRHQLWGKAKDYLEMSIQLNPTPEAYAELGRLLSYLGESERCQDCYRKGLFAVTEVLNLEKQ
jgi:HemY protein